MLEWLGNQPLAVWYLPYPSLALFAALIVGALLLILPGIPATRLAGMVLCLPALLNRPAAPANGDFELTALDVGQGLSVVVRTRSHVLVYDTGPAFGTDRDAGVIAVVPFLRYRGVRSLDTLIVSHGDLDHDGGMRSIMAALPVRRLLTGPTVATRSGSVCRRGQRMGMGRREIRGAASDRWLRRHATTSTSCVLQHSQSRRQRADQR